MDKGLKVGRESVRMIIFSVKSQYPFDPRLSVLSHIVFGVAQVTVESGLEVHLELILTHSGGHRKKRASRELFPLPVEVIRECCRKDNLVKERFKGTTDDDPRMIQQDVGMTARPPK